MLLVYASDLHGHWPHYSALDELCRERRPRVLVLGGDLLPKEAGRLVYRIPAQAECLFGRVLPMLAALREECGTLSLVMLGNDDFAAHQQPLEQECEKLGLLSLHGRSVTVDDVAFAGCSYVSYTPFRLKDWELPEYRGDMPRTGCIADGCSGTYRTAEPPAEQSVAESLRKLVLHEAATQVLVVHAPPYGTGLDRLWDGTGAGSVAVRDFVLEQQPTVSLHGHIHESPRVSGRWAETLGSTLAFQPGQTPERLHAVVLDTSDPGGTAWHTVYGALATASWMP
jgi:Icc-related predicted phosphoesterase